MSKSLFLRALFVMHFTQHEFWFGSIFNYDFLPAILVVLFRGSFFSESILFWVKSYQVAFQHKCFYCLSSHSVHGGTNDILRARCIRHLESNVKEITHSESSKTTFSLLLLKVFLWFRISRFLHPKSNVFYKYNQYPDHIQKHIL